MNLFKKILAVAMAIALVALAGCVGGNTTWVYKNGENQVSAGMYILFELGALSQAESKLAEENKDNADYVPAETPAEFMKLTVEGQPVSAWMQAEAEKSVRKYYAVLQKFDSLGLTLDETELADIDTQVTSILSQSADFYKENGISEDSIRSFYMYTIKQNKLFDTLYSAGGEFAVPEEELKTYFSTNYAKVDIMALGKLTTVPEGETKTLEELNAEVKQTAESYLQRMKDGEDMETMAYEWQLASTPEDQKATVTKPEKGQLTMILAESERGNYGDLLMDAVFGAPMGEPQLLDDTGYYALFTRSDVLADSADLEYYRPAVIGELKYEEFLEKLTEWGSEIQLETNQASIKRYTPDKIKFADQEQAAQ